MNKRHLWRLIAVACMVFACSLPADAAHVHQWQEASCTAPKTCEVCKQTEGEALEHTWTEKTSKKTLKKCKVCKKGFEYYKHPETKEIIAWTEYVLTKDGKRSEPVSHYANSDEVVEWLKDGEVQLREKEDKTPHMYYVGGKIYYYIPYAYNTSKSTIKKMAQAARKKISASQYSWFEGNWDDVILLGKEGWQDCRGAAWPAVDAGGTKYVIAQKYATEKSPEKYYAIKTKW